MEPGELQRLVQGDSAAWNTFVDRYSGWILRVARATLRRLTGRDDDAEDILGEVFRLLLEREFALLRSLRPPYHLQAWLAVLTRRTCTRSFRKKVPPPAERPSSDAPEAAGLREMLDRLPLRDRVLLELFFVHECSYEEISEIMGVSLDSIGQLKFRALQKLREFV